MIGRSGMLEVHKASCALLHRGKPIASLMLTCFFIIVGFALFSVSNKSDEVGIDQLHVQVPRMAEAIGFIASIVTVVGAAESVAKILNSVRSLANAPDEICALVNEVSDFIVVLRDIHNYAIRTETAITSSPHLGTLSSLIDRANGRLLLLQRLLQAHVLKPNRANRQFVTRAQWALVKNRINGLRTDIRDIRSNMIVQIATISWCVK